MLSLLLIVAGIAMIAWRRPLAYYAMAEQPWRWSPSQREWAERVSRNVIIICGLFLIVLNTLILARVIPP